MSEILLPIPIETSQCAAHEGHLKSRSRTMRRAIVLQRQALALWFILKDRRTSWCTRAIASLALAYLFSPVQLIPNFIPVIGLIDDIAIAAVGMKLVRCLTPEPVLRELGTLAWKALDAGKINIKPLITRTTTIAIAVTWLMGTIVAALFIYKV